LLFSYLAGRSSSDQPAFNRDRLKAEKLIDSKVLEQLIRIQMDAGCSRLHSRFLPSRNPLMEPLAKLEGSICERAAAVIPSPARRENPELGRACAPKARELPRSAAASQPKKPVAERAAAPLKHTADTE
jgi:hypothetical protein